MANISVYLAKILSAIYGEDVRGSIHDAIEIINDVSEVVLTTGTAVTSASSSSEGFYNASLYLNTNTMELWKCIGTNLWQSQGTLKGANGADGTPGVGIASIAKTATAGLVDTYTITYTDGNTTTFNVTNGADGQDGTNGSVWYKGTALDGTGSGITGFPGNENDFYLNASTGNVYQCTATGTALTALWDYVMTLTGGGGSSVTVVDNLNSTSGTDALSANMGHSINNPTITEAGSRTNIATGDTLPTIFGKIKKYFSDLKTVAFSGSYDDLSNKPTIPAAQVNSDWNASSGVAQILNKPTIPSAANNGTLTIQKNGATVGTFTANQSGNTTANIEVDYWSSTATVQSDNTVTFSGLNDTYGYELYCENKLIGISAITKTGSGTSTTLKYTVTGAATGDVCKLRILR